MVRILVIDDNDQFREMLMDILKNEGYDVVAASNGKEGVARYREQPAELIITDILMPEKDGMETISDLGKDFPDVKIIVISGGGQEGSSKDYLESIGAMCNIKHAFSKPFDMDEMLKIVRELVNQ